MILRGLQRWKETPWFSSQILLEDVRRRERKIKKCVCHSWGKTQSKWKKMETWSIRLTLVPKSQCLIAGVTWQNWCALPKRFSALVLYRGFIPCVQPTRRANQEKSQFEGSFESQERNQKYKTNADIRYTKLFQGNILDIVPKWWDDEMAQSEIQWEFQIAEAKNWKLGTRESKNNCLSF